MSGFDKFKEYIFEEDDKSAAKAKHSFYSLAQEEIVEAQERMKLRFPLELESFYKQVGYGFMWNEDDNMFDRVMDPQSVADFYLCEGMYQTNDYEEHYERNFLVFFEVNESSYIALDLSAKNELGKCPVYYLDSKIANSLEEFLSKMDEKLDYYLEY